MATGHNTWILDGRIAFEPELRTTPSGVPVCTLRLCWSKKVGNKESSLFVNAVFWRALAQTAVHYLHKGDLVGVEGEAHGAMRTKQDGSKEYMIEINVDKLVFFPQSGKQAGERVEVTERDAERDAERGAPYGLPAGDMEEVDGDLPF